jgi:putative ABC transport system permease protein
MIRHLIKLFWSRKRSNLSLLVEIFVSFIVLFAVSLIVITNIIRFKQPLGFDYHDVYTISFDWHLIMNNAKQEDLFLTTSEVIKELNSLPAVVAVAAISPDPFGMTSSSNYFECNGKSIIAHSVDASDQADKVLGLNMLRGRWFEEADDALDWTPVVVNKKLADELYEGEDIIGMLVGEDGNRKIVGVFEEYRYGGEMSRPDYVFFERTSLSKYKDNGDPILSILLRTTPGTTAEFEESTIKHIQPLLQNISFRIKSLSLIREAQNKLRATPAIIAVLVAGFLMIMVMLGMTGIFWQNITARTNEIGLRRALGSSKKTLYRQLFSEIVVITSIGNILASILMIQIPLIDAFSNIGITSIIGAIGLSALLIYSIAILSALYPVLMASRLDPAEALHYE